jgi:lipopolysaccharide biosynthesis glycosyltransferase
MLRIFIGYDGREAVAFHTLAASLLEHASQPLSIIPLRLSLLRGVFDRPRNPVQSTDFAFSRFLVPHLSDYTGWSLFMDCDIVVLRDIAELWSHRDPRYAVQVVKHEHRPFEDTKFLGQVQTRYEKKNWSSVMLFNNERCRRLTPAYVNTASGLELHQFKWLDGDDEIGELPSAWNFLVGYDTPGSDLAALHYTSGGPWFRACADVPYADVWRRYHDRVNHVEDVTDAPAARLAVSASAR